MRHARMEPTERVVDAPFMVPYRHLAIRVLASALRDISDPARSPTDRESARLFFAGSTMLFHWCRVAAVDPHRIVHHVATLTGARTAGTLKAGAADMEGTD